MLKTTLIEIAEEDLNVSKLLHGQRLFPYSIFYLQQSVEKLVKHIGISHGIISPENLQKEINHKTIKVFNRLVYRTLEFTGDTKEDLDNDYFKIMEANRKFPLYELLPVIKNTIETYKKSDLPDNFEELIKKLIIFVQKKEIRNHPTNITARSQENWITKVKEFYPSYQSSMMSLFILSNFLSDYVSYVRYPTKDGFINPSHIFTFDHDLVKYLPYFFECQYENIKSTYQFQTFLGIIKND